MDLVLAGWRLLGIWVRKEQPRGRRRAARSVDLVLAAGRRRSKLA